MSLIEITGVQNQCMYEHNKTLGIAYALHMLLKQGPFFTVVHCIMRSFIL